MTDSPDKRTDDTASTINVVEPLVLIVMSGLALKTAYTSFDLLLHVSELAAFNVLIVAALVGPLLAVSVGVVAVVVVVLTIRRMQSRRLGWTAVLADGHVGGCQRLG